MKKIIKMAAMCSLAIIVVAGCKKGDKGDPGTPGTNGTNGNANVSSMTFTTTTTDWWSSGTYYDTAHFNLPLLDNNMVSKGAILCYVNYSGEWIQIPYTNMDSQVQIDYGYRVGSAHITVADISPAPSVPNAAGTIVKFVFIAGKSIKQMPYQELKSKYGLKD